MFRLSAELLRRLSPKSTSVLLAELKKFQDSKVGESFLKYDHFFDPGVINVSIPFGEDVIKNENLEGVNQVLLTILGFHVAHDVAFHMDLTQTLNVFLQDFSACDQDPNVEKIPVVLSEEKKVKIGEGKFLFFFS